MRRLAAGARARILYLTTARVPSIRAHSIQIVKTCDALRALGVDVVLVVPMRAGMGGGVKDVSKFYGLRTPPRIVRIPCLDILRRTRRKSLAYLLLVLSFYFVALILLFLERLRGDFTTYLRERRLLVLAWLTKPVHRSEIIYEMHEVPRFSGFTGILQRRALIDCKHVVVISGVQRRMLRRCGLPLDVAVIPDAADPSIADYRRGGVAELKRELRIPEDKLVVTYSGQLSEWKRPEFIIEAARFVSDERIVFVFVGGRRRDVERLRRFAERVGVADRVIFVGAVKPSEVARYLKASDILVHYSASWGDMASLSPLKLFEYMLSGRPFLAPDQPQIREIIEDGVNGFLYEADDPRALAELIERVAGMDEEEKRRVSARALEIALREYTYDARARKILKLITGFNG